MNNKFLRTELLLKSDAMAKLNNSRVAVFGIGGVGSYVLEALVRAGIGAIDIIDIDVVSESNINRQLIATTKTIGMPKVDVGEARCLEINPDVKINKYQEFFTPETADSFNFKEYNYIVDAIDTVTGKLALIEKAQENNVPIISCMGTGNKLDPTKFEVTDIYKTSVCPLARIMRKECKARGIKKLKCVYSKEEPIIPMPCNENIGTGRRSTPGSISFVPSVAGLIIAGEVIKDLIKYYF